MIIIPTSLHINFVSAISISAPYGKFPVDMPFLFW